MEDEEYDGFEWDEGKSDRALRERGFDFWLARRVFESKYIESVDDRCNYGEVRFIAVGTVDGRFITVVWTPRGTVRRIIAAWRSSDQERRKYRGQYPD